MCLAVILSYSVWCNAMPEIIKLTSFLFSSSYKTWQINFKLYAVLISINIFSSASLASGGQETGISLFCMEVKSEYMYYQNCSVLDCVTQCSQSAAFIWAVLTGPTDWVCHIATLTLSLRRLESWPLACQRVINQGRASLSASPNGVQIPKFVGFEKNWHKSIKSLLHSFIV